MATVQLETLQQRYGGLIDREITEWLDHYPSPPGFASMLRYQLGYDSPEGAGKRFRPILCLVACRACGGNEQDALPVAAGIELLHNFSLIHDDIEDRDPERRHRPALWTVWGEAQAINAGDAMFALAARAVAECPARDLSRDLIIRFQDMVMDLTHGQYLDMSFESRADVTPEEYMAMIRMKSAAIIAFSLEAGALLANADAATVQGLRSFGLAMGKAFQIWDDILGIWGTADRTGKQEAKDLENRKKTLPVLLGLARAEGEVRGTLRRYMEGTQVQTESVRAALTEIGAREAAERIMREERGKALEALERARIDPIARAALGTLAEQLTGS